MSRCFPFPPPGYEKKTKTDDADLLKKEKHREKKHKEKKDKEKREGKEKREKERSDGKHRDKKDRKEKHRDKKKDRDKDKDKSCTSEEKRITGESEIYNGENLNQKEREWDNDKKSSISNEKKQGRIGEKPIQNNLLSEGAGDSKFVQELGRRIRDEEKGNRSQLVQGLPGTEQKNDERMGRVVVKDTGICAEGKENNTGKRVDDRKIDGQGIRGGARTSGSAVVQNFAGMVQNRVEGMPRPMEKNIEKRMDEKDKSKEREGDKKRGDKQKDRDGEKKSHGKDKDREKEKKKEEKLKEKSEHKNKEQDKLKDRNKNDLLCTLNTGTSHVSKDGDRNAVTEGNLKKRKDFGTNGFLHETDIRPSKMQRPGPHLSTENGKKLEPCRTAILSTSDRQGAPNNLKVDNKECKVNGVIEAKSFPISPRKTSATSQADKIAQASMKPMPPHPDSKYLTRLLSVPKMEEWSDFDDQEWLLSRKGQSSEKPDVGSTGVPDVPRVWAQALQIESADVCALPYVIPY